MPVDRVDRIDLVEVKLQGWSRTYANADTRRAPLLIDQIVGDHAVRLSQPAGRVQLTLVKVHGLPARLLTERDKLGRLQYARVAWDEGGFTFLIGSSPDRARQVLLDGPAVLRVAEGLTVRS